MRAYLAILLFTAVLASTVVAQDCMSKLATSNFVDTARCYGYPVETHVIITDDGYKLTIFRIQAKRTTIAPNKPVVLMWHGLLDSADSWIVNEEHLAPAFVLANKGYDIWLGNSRGNKYSLDHVSLDSTKSTDFWAFSWQHMSEHDLPAAFSYIANFTGQKINYIGHSQGTTQMWAALSNPSGRNPKIVNNLRKFAALGPVTYMGNVRSSLLLTMAKLPLLPQLLQQVAKYGLFLPNWLSSEAGRAFCKTFSWSCSFGMSLISDEKSSANNQNILDRFAGHFPAGTSVQDFLHWRQAINSRGSFQKYDYGVDNYKIYGQSKPPQYNPALVTEEVGLFVGTDDLLATPPDAQRWVRDLVNAKYKQLRYYPMGHLSFMIGKELTYMEDLLAFLDIQA